MHDRKKEMPRGGRNALLERGAVVHAEEESDRDVKIERLIEIRIRYANLRRYT